MFFSNTLPTAWDIPSRPAGQFTNHFKNQTVKGFYLNDPVEYTYNNLGYRCFDDYVLEDLKNKKIVICLGDSDTFGAGVEYKDIWPTKLNNALNDYTVLNFGIPGISNDGIARVAVRLIKALGSSIHAICIHYPSYSLREFVSKNYKGGVHTHRNYNLPYKDWWQHIDWQSNNYNFYKNKHLIEYACRANGVELYDIYINKDDNKVPYDAIEYGVYTSIGPCTHSAIAEYFYKKINKQPSLFESLQS